MVTDPKYSLHYRTNTHRRNVAAQVAEEELKTVTFAATPPVEERRKKERKTLRDAGRFENEAIPWTGRQ